MNKTLVINFPTLKMGGIENCIYTYIRYAFSKGFRVIWLCYKEKVIADSFKTVLSQIECVRVNRPGSKTILIDPLNLDGHTVILSFTPLFLNRALLLSECFRHCSIVNLYIVANTKGRFYYIEDNFWGFVRRSVKREASRYNQMWAQHGYIRFFTKLQAESFERCYGIKLDNLSTLLVPPSTKPKELDRITLSSRVKRDEFNLISVTRFQFPHKQYIIGLIKDYGILKKKYPQLKLHIVGYGPGQSLVEDTIKSLDTIAQNDVTLYGEMSKDQLVLLMDRMHLNVSVAGSVRAGAGNGVLSIPARNYCEGDCEVYGYLPETLEKVTATEPGMRAIGFIEEVINMSDEEYEKKCIASYEAYSRRITNPDYFYEQKNELMDIDDIKRGFRFYRRIQWPGDICFKIKKTLGKN